jgi:hypothetical protein
MRMTLGGNLVDYPGDVSVGTAEMLLLYTPAQVMNWATLLVYNTGLFYDKLKKWDATPAAHKTYKEFCNHILEAQQVYHRQQQTSKQSG